MKIRLIACCMIVLNSTSVFAAEEIEIGLKCNLEQKKIEASEKIISDNEELLERELSQLRYHVVIKNGDYGTGLVGWLSIDATKYDKTASYGFVTRLLKVEPLMYFDPFRENNDPIIEIRRDTLELKIIYILNGATVRSEQQFAAARYKCSIVDSSIFYLKAKEAADQLIARQKI